jgi:hypothetical protein
LSTWRTGVYNFYTNSLAFKDSKRDQIALTTNKYRILLIGDSFTEGLGYPYEQIFAGIIDRLLEQSNIDILNAGVVTYSPKLYYLKTKYLLEKTGLRFNELFVYIDISDIQDEIVYESFSPSKRLSIPRHINIFLKNNSYIYNKIGRNVLRHIVTKAKSIGSPSRYSHKRSIKKTRNNKNEGNLIDMDIFYKNYHEKTPKWTLDNKIYQTWGKKGLSLAEENMRKLFFLCNEHGIKMTIAVYPWPYQIRNRDINSIQVSFWKSFAKKHNIGFINYFPDFINSESPNDIYKKYFIPEGVHWNEHGHELIAKKLLNRINLNLPIRSKEFK